jgi:hypothetical protein
MNTCGDGEPDSLPMDAEALSIVHVLAETGRANDIAEAAARVPWAACSAADLAWIVRLAPRAGAHLLARDVAARGAQRYPNHAELQKMARILAPPRTVRRDVPTDRSWAANRAWPVAHGEAYRGQWVALKEGELLAAAPTARRVCDAVDRAIEVLILKVP